MTICCSLSVLGKPEDKTNKVAKLIYDIFTSLGA